MKRVAFFMPSFRGGGAERVISTLAEALAGQGIAADVVVAQAEGPNRPQAGLAGLRVIDLAARRVIAGLPALVRYLREARPDAMLSALPHCNVIAAWARRLARSTTRLVVSEHTIASLSAAHSNLWRARMLPSFMRRAYRSADAIVAVSDGVASDLSALLGIDRTAIARIYNPIVTPRLHRLAAEPPGHPWFGTAQPPVILGVGRLTAAKDFRTLVQAFAVLRQRRSIRLMILGEGEERGALESLSRTLGVQDDVSMPGFADNPFAYMKRSAVFVVSSRWEGFCNALVEAMACGAPVVSTRCEGPLEILECGRHGRLAAIGDAQALAAAIESQLDAPAPPSAAARAQDFGVDAAVGAYRRLLSV